MCIQTHIVKRSFGDETQHLISDSIELKISFSPGDFALMPAMRASHAKCVKFPHEIEVESRYFLVITGNIVLVLALLKHAWKVRECCERFN